MVDSVGADQVRGNFRDSAMDTKMTGAVVTYLDLNHVINLAQEIKSGTTPLFDRLLHLSQTHKVVFVASAMHFWEIFEIRDPQQRKNITHVLKSLTNKLVIRDYEHVQHMEINNLIARHFEVKGKIFPLPFFAFSVGYFESFGRVTLEPPEGAAHQPELYAKIEKELYALLQTDEAIDIMMDRFDVLPKMQEDDPVHTQLKSAIVRDRENWKALSFHKKERENLLQYQHRLISKFDEYATRLDIKVNGLHPLLPDQFRGTEVLATLPTINMWAKMNMFIYHKDLTAKVDVNDLMDIGHLSVAVPYCDVVVCDNKMHSVLVSSKLDQEYKTAIFRNLAEATDYLEDRVTGIAPYLRRAADRQR